MREAILVVDDEPFVLNVVSLILRNAGFEVFTANCAETALDFGRCHREPIRLLLADVVMPGASGPSLAEQFAVIHPETECLFMAGLPDTPEICEKIIDRGRPFLPKPFVPQTLVSKVREVLNGV